jgi:hypothetical protein
MEPDLQVVAGEAEWDSLQVQGPESFVYVHSVALK